MANTIDEAKTPAELAAWLRFWAEAYEEGVDYLDDNDARQLAEAVERVCAPCNAAVTREALMKAKLYFDHRGEGTNLDDAGMAIDAILSIDDALAAPARNCDKYTTGEEALRAFQAEWKERHGQMDLILDWLFAPAKEPPSAEKSAK